MPRPLEELACDVCGQRSLARVQIRYEEDAVHDGRPPVRIVIPDLDIIACTNPECRPEHPHDTQIIDRAASQRIETETYRQLGLLTPAEIRENRERLNLTQQQLADLLGLGGNSLSRWENGREYQKRSMDTLLRIVFGVPDALSFAERLHQNPERKRAARQASNTL